MKYCVHCGKELLDEATACPYCGEIIGSGNKKKHHRHLVIALVILLAAFLLVVSVVFVWLGKPRLNEEENYALMVTQQIQEGLLVPDSLYIYDLYVNLYNEEEESSNVLGETGGAFVHYSAENRGGGTTENAVVAYFYPDGITILSEDDILEVFQSQNDGTMSDGLVEALAGNIYRTSVERFRDNGTEIDPQRILKWLN